MAKEDFLFLENPMPGQVLRKFSKEQPQGQKSSSSSEPPVPEDEALLDDADLITSSVANEGNYHKPILDIDFGAKLIESSTPGHYHLYLDKEISWYRYKKLLQALASAGIIEHGFAEASINRGYSAVRLPWIDKPAQAEEDKEMVTSLLVPQEHNYDKLNKELDDMKLHPAESNPFTDELLPKVKKLKGSDAYPFPFSKPALTPEETDELLDF